MRTSDKEIRWREFTSRSDLHGAFLDEAAEGGDAAAGADHDDGCVLNVIWGVEVSVGRLDGDVNEVGFFDGGEVVGCYTEETLSACGFGGSVEDGPG